MKFSIIVPFYNAERYLRAALDSVRRQTYTDWECVCTNDGSTDGTETILAEYAANDNRFIVIQQPNGGEGAARNTAMEHMTGDWFVFLDADDILDPGLVPAAHKLDIEADIILCDYRDADLFVYRFRHFIDGESPQWSDCDARGIAFDCCASLPKDVLSMCVWGCGYLSAKYRDVRFIGLQIGADLEFISRCLAHTDKVIVSDFIGLGVRISSGSMSRRERTPAMMIDTIDFRRMVFENLLKSGKTLPAAYVRSSGNQWFESTPAMFASKPMKGEWNRVWEHWFDSLEVASMMPLFSKWQRFVIKMIGKTRSRLFVFLLCVLPNRLKKMGLHR